MKKMKPMIFCSVLVALVAILFLSPLARSESKHEAQAITSDHLDIAYGDVNGTWFTYRIFQENGGLKKQLIVNGVVTSLGVLEQPKELSEVADSLFIPLVKLVGVAPESKEQQKDVQRFSAIYVHSQRELRLSLQADGVSMSSLLGGSGNLRTLLVQLCQDQPKNFRFPIIIDGNDRALLQPSTRP